MKVTKFNSSSPPSFVMTDIFSNLNANIIMASWGRIDNDDIKLSDGDYLIQDDDGKLVGHITAAAYASGNSKTQIIKEHVGKDLLRTIWQTLAQSGLTDAVKASILNTISVTLIAILAGEVKAARIICNATTTTADFTNGRKSVLLNLIDASIAQL